jgi:hypothetical protein
MNSPFSLVFRRFVLLTALVGIPLSGCSTTRYVTVPCVSQEQYEKLKADEPEKVHDKLTGKADEDIRTIGGSAVRLRAYSQGLLGVLGGCVG